MTKRKLEDIDFGCIVCTDILVEPVSFQCGHTMCMECMEKLNDEKCPVCRQSFRSQNVKKNVLLDTVLQTIYDKWYTRRIQQRQYLKSYYQSERFDVLCDTIIDIVTEGREIVKENDEDREFPKFMLTLDDIIDMVTKSDINEQFKYHHEEIIVCVHDQLKDKQVQKVKNYYILNSEDWVVETIIEAHKQLEDQDILHMLSGIIKSNINHDLGGILKRRRHDGTKRDIDIEQTQSQLIDLIKNKKIEL